jgi:FkbM family methyltransferase
MSLLYQKIIQRAPSRYRSPLFSAVSLLSSQGKTKASVNGLQTWLDLNESIQRSMYLGVYEPTQTAWFKECVKAGDVFFDVGANFGHYTSLASGVVGNTGRVYAFEPSPKANQTIEDMIALSKVDNITLVKAALGKEKGTVTLYMPNTDGLHSPSIMKSDDDFKPIEIPVISLDDYATEQNIQTVKLMKIDVEGYEPNVLDGMTRLLAERRVQNVFCEFNSWWLEQNGYTSKMLYDRFIRAGFKVHKQTDLQENLIGHKGVTFSLQDIWFTLS